VEDILKRNSDRDIRVFAVWEPILPTDFSSPGTAVLSRLSDPRVAQDWDKNHLFAGALERRLETDATQPRPSCCKSRGVEWDEVAVYDRNARWDAQLPRAAFLNGPVVESLDFSKVVSELLSPSASPR
jgi:hypothetical protein